MKQACFFKCLLPQCAFMKGPLQASAGVASRQPGWGAVSGSQDVCSVLVYKRARQSVTRNREDMTCTICHFFFHNWGLRRCKAWVSVIKLELWRPSSHTSFSPRSQARGSRSRKRWQPPKSGQIPTGDCAVGLSQLGFSLAPPLGPSLSRTHDGVWDQHQLILTRCKFSVKW